MTKKEDDSAAPSTERTPPLESSFPIVGVGASAGGMEAFTELLRDMPTATGVAFVLIQHLDPTHPSFLRDALARTTTLPVHEIQDGQRVEPGHVYVTPSHADVGMLKGVFSLFPRPTETRPRHLPIDFFFKALAADRAHQAIGIVLSGTGSDGVEGLRAIKAEGGITLAQEPRSAKFSGMPQAAIAADVVDIVRPLPELAGELQRVAAHPLWAVKPDVLASPADTSDLEKVFVLLRGAVGVDFSDYKATSVRRRLARRMAVHRLTALRDYVQLLRDDPREAPLLVEDLLIHVTSFFRDPGSFDALAERVFPDLLQLKRAGGTIRIWCAGCSTGEEAYSLVIALREFLAREQADVPVQLFGSDISEKAIAVARAGIYSEAALREVDPERLARYFTRLDGGSYQITKSIRERCAFVRHDLTSDPPFSKLDLVSCRNLLIYFGPDLQKRVLATLHFALNYPGYLSVGRAENVTDASLFTPIDSDAKIFARTAAGSVLRIVPARDLMPAAAARTEPMRRVPPLDSLLRKAEDRLLDHYAPPGVIVNGRMEILRFRGRTGSYLEPAAGEPQSDLVKMARPGLAADLRIAVSQAQKSGTTVRRAGVRVEQNGSTRTCDVVVIPLVAPPDARETLFAVLFEQPRRSSAAESPVTTASVAAVPADDERVAKLETDLGATKAYLQSIIEDHQRSNEDLMSANEELLSSNEELQSLNEELQTAKEELQSTNEELATLNEELHARNAELDSVNNDLINILGSVEVPIVIVDGQRLIRRFTPKARPILNLLPVDVGRPIDDIKPTIAIEDLDRKIADVIETVVIHEEEVRGPDGRWYRLQIRPYLATGRRIEGAVITVMDIDALKRALSAAEFARDFAKATVEAVRTPLVVLDGRSRLVSANRAFRELLAEPDAKLEGEDLFTLQSGAWRLPALRSALERVLETGEPFDELVLEPKLPTHGARTVSLSGRAVATPSPERLVLLSIEDITDRQRGEVERERLFAEAETAKASAEAANRAKDQFLAMLSHELRTPLSTLLMQAQLMLQTKMDEERVRRAGETIDRAARAQAQLIDDLLDISRIVTGKLRMEMQPVRLTSIVQEATDVVRSSADLKHIAFELHLDEAVPPVSGDPARLRQVVLNLLTNAIKFTPERGNVSVIVDAIDARGRIRVSDTGAGIEPSFLPHVFERFTQEDREQTRRVGGLGLGLGIVRYIVQAHGGTVEAASEGKGKGATFTVLIPLLKGAAPVVGPEARAPTPRTEVSLEGTRILIVEDDRGTREALTEMLALAGAETRSAASAADAMDVFEAFRPELLVCDIAMPDEDGYSLLRRIRALGPARGGDVRALALTALASDEDRRRATEAGFQQHVAKPVDITRLVTALAGLRAAPADRSNTTRPA
jgi:two-component system CheB/CheR fusion protein